MSKWIFGSHTLQFNPSQDTTWHKEHVTGTPHPIGRTVGAYQRGGFKSATREIQGLVKHMSEYNVLQGLYWGDAQFTLTDHHGNVYTNVTIDDLKWDSIMDATNDGNDFTSYKYTMKLVQVGL